MHEDDDDDDDGAYTFPQFVGTDLQNTFHQPTSTMNINRNRVKFHKNENVKQFAAIKQRQRHKIDDFIPNICIGFHLHGVVYTIIM